VRIRRGDLFYDGKCEKCTGISRRRGHHVFEYSVGFAERYEPITRDRLQKQRRFRLRNDAKARPGYLRHIFGSSSLLSLQSSSLSHCQWSAMQCPFLHWNSFSEHVTFAIPVKIVRLIISSAVHVAGTGTRAAPTRKRGHATTNGGVDSVGSRIISGARRTSALIIRRPSIRFERRSS